MIVLLDCDGVLADFVGGLCEHLPGRTPESFGHWDLAATLTPEESARAAKVLSYKGFAAWLPWYDGARHFVRSLRVTHEVHVVTSPYETSPTWMHERKAWLEHELSRDRVHFVHGKHKRLFRGDVLVEDHPGNAAAWLDHNPSGVAVLIDRPWNRPSSNEWTLHTRLYRAHSYGEALQIIEGL